MTIDALPAAPSRSDDPATFIAKADAFVAALPNFVSQVNAVAQAGDFNAELWVSGTTYAAGDRVYSPIDFATYRRKTNGAGTTDPSLDTTNWAPVAAVIPPGMFGDFGGTSAPAGWLVRDGSAVSRTTYAALFAAIGTTWGAGDGSTTFNLPNSAGKTTIGSGSGVVTESGADADVNTGTDTLTVPSNTRKWITGQQVTFTLTSGTITGLSSGGTYYVVRSGATGVKLASSLANAQNGTVVDMTAKSSPVWTISHALEARTVGQVGGEESHAMSSTELLAHTHSGSSIVSSATPGGSNGAGGSIGSTGGNAAMNVMSPFAVALPCIKY